jgi:DNA mismatch repair protein MutS
MGSFVPASSAHIGLVDRIFVRAGAIDDISQGRSTFLVEMSEMSYILNHATSRSFIVLDEVGRGTSTYDGMSLAWAVVEEIHDFIGARTLFATHYHELTELAEHLWGVKNYSLAVRERGREVIFLYRLVQGGMDKSYGVQVARLAGLPERVIERAEEVMARLEGVRKEAKELREIGGRLLLPVDDEAVWEVVREIFGLDIANMTPVQALVALNELQERLRR